MAASEGEIEVVKTQSETGKALASAKHKKRAKRRLLPTFEQNGPPGPSNLSESETTESLIPPISTAKDKKEEAPQSPEIESSNAPSPELNYSVATVKARFKAIAEQAPPKNPKPIEPKIQSTPPQETKKSDALSFFKFKMIVSKTERKKQKKIAEAERLQLVEQQRQAHEQWEIDYDIWAKEEELAEQSRSKLKQDISRILWDALAFHVKNFKSNLDTQNEVEKLVIAYYIATTKIVGKLPKDISSLEDGDIETGLGLLKRADFKEALNIFSQHESDKNFKDFCAMLLYTDTLMCGGQFTGWARQDWFLSKSFFSNDFWEDRDPPAPEIRKENALDIIKTALCNERVKRKCVEVILGDSDKSIHNGVKVLSAEQKKTFSNGVEKNLEVVFFPKKDTIMLKLLPNPSEEDYKRAKKELVLTPPELTALTDSIVSIFNSMFPPSKDNGEDEKFEDEEKKEGDGFTDTNLPTDTSDDPSLAVSDSENDTFFELDLNSDDKKGTPISTSKPTPMPTPTPSTPEKPEGSISSSQPEQPFFPAAAEDEKFDSPVCSLPKHFIKIHQTPSVSYEEMRFYLLDWVLSKESSFSQEAARRILNAYNTKQEPQKKDKKLLKAFPADYIENGNRTEIIEDEFKKEITFIEKKELDIEVSRTSFVTSGESTTVEVSCDYDCAYDPAYALAIAATVNAAQKLRAISGKNDFIFDLDFREDLGDETEHAVTEECYRTALLNRKIILKRPEKVNSTTINRTPPPAIISQPITSTTPLYSSSHTPQPKTPITPSQPFGHTVNSKTPTSKPTGDTVRRKLSFLSPTPSPYSPLPPSSPQHLAAAPKNPGANYDKMRNYLLAEALTKSELGVKKEKRPLSPSQEAAERVLTAYEKKKSTSKKDKEKELTLFEAEDLLKELSIANICYAEDESKITIEEDSEAKKITLVKKKGDQKTSTSFSKNSAGTTDVEILGAYEEAVEATVSAAQKLCIISKSNVFVFDLDLSKSPEDEVRRPIIEAHYCAELLEKNIVPILSRYENGAPGIARNPETAVWETYKSLRAASDGTDNTYLEKLFYPENKSLKTELITAMFAQSAPEGSVIKDSDDNPVTIQQLLSMKDTDKAKEIITAQFEKKKEIKASNSPTAIFLPPPTAEPPPHISLPPSIGMKHSSIPTE